MSDEKVLLRLRGSGLPADVGTIVEQLPAGHYVVRWQPSGPEEKVQTGNVIRAAERGSLRFEAWTNPEGLVTRFDSDPVQVVLQLIRESKTASKTTDIKAGLTSLGLPKAAVDRYWTKIKKDLDRHPNVAREGKPAAYRWTDQPVDPHAAVRATKPVDALNRLVAAKVMGDERDILMHIVESTATQDAVFATMAGAVGVGAEPGQWPSPLVAAERLFEFDERVVSEALSKVAEPGVVLGDREFAALLATPRRRDAEWALGPITGDRLKRVVNAFVDGLDERRTRDASRFVATFVQRLLSNEQRTALTLTEMLRLWLRVTPTLRRDQTRPLDDLANEVAERWRDSASAEIDLVAIQRCLSRLPLAPESGRARLLAAIGRADITLLRNPAWWRSVELDQLADAAAGPLARALSDEEVAAVAVRPLLKRAIEDADDRRPLARLIGFPEPIARLIEPAEIRVAFRRIAGSNALLANWLEALSGSDEAQRAEAALAVADARARQALERAERADMLAAELGERVAALESRLQTQYQESTELRARQQRQARIDVLRSLVEVAIEAHLMSSSAPNDLVPTVDRIVGRHGLERIGLPGEEVEFDPRLHELAVGELTPGEGVFVVRPGYLLREQGGADVITKALVRKE